MHYQERIHLVYLLTRNSDSQQYVGISIRDRFKNRVSQHKISDRFKDDTFTFEILVESKSRKSIEQLEEYFISEYDTYNNGLNQTPEGRGYGHGSTKFTTFGLTLSDETKDIIRQKSRETAKREGPKIRSQRSKDNWLDEEYRTNQIRKKRGKRMSPPKLSDEQVEEIRALWLEKKEEYTQKVKKINEEILARNGGLRTRIPEAEFAKDVHQNYGVTWNQIKNIVLWKSRTKKYVDAYK